MQTTSNQKFKLTTLDWIFTALVGFACLALYIRTLAPGVVPGDSAEFQVLAHQLGIAHTPGYPVYLLLAKIATLLPVGDIAYRVNLFSAVMATLAVVGVYFAARLIDLNSWAALFGAAAFSVSYSLWSQAVIAEVYTSAAAFTGLILVCVLGWGKTGKRWLLFAAGLMGGLSLGIHTTVLLLAPGVFVYLWLHRKTGGKFWGAAVGGVVTGVLIWALAFIALEFNAPPANIFMGAYETARSNWGLSQAQIENPWVRIWFVATGQQWSSALDFDLDGMLGQAGGYLAQLPREFSAVTLLLILTGMAHLIRERRDVAALLGFSLLAHWLVCFNYHIWDIYVFYITGYLILALLAAIGLDWLGQILVRLLPKGRQALQVGITLLVLVFAVWPVILPRLPALQAGEVPFVGESGFPLWEGADRMGETAAITVEQMKPDSVFFVDWNWLYVYYYAAHVEADRSDLRFIEAAPRADTPGLPGSVVEFVEANIDSRPIYFLNPPREVEQAGFDFQRRQIWFTDFYKVTR